MDHYKIITVKGLVSDSLFMVFHHPKAQGDSRLPRLDPVRIVFRVARSLSFPPVPLHSFDTHE